MTYSYQVRQRMKQERSIKLSNLVIQNMLFVLMSISLVMNITRHLVSTFGLNLPNHGVF